MERLTILVTSMIRAVRHVSWSRSVQNLPPPLGLGRMALHKTIHLLKGSRYENLLVSDDLKNFDDSRA